MSLIVKIPGVTFTKSMPKLYRDAVINSGTLACYDAVNAASWPKQAAPANGNPSADKWKNLVDGVADGLFTTPSGEITFSGGFVSNGTSSTDKITLLNASVPAAPSSLLGIIWVKHGEPGSTGELAMANFSGWLTIGYTGDGVASVPSDRFYIASSASASQEIPGAPVLGQVYQLAASYNSAARMLNVYKNGVLVASRAGYADLASSATPMALMQQSGVGGAYVGTFYRVVADKLTAGMTDAEIVALDYALNVGRFS